MTPQTEQLLDRYFDGEATDADWAQLTDTMSADRDVRIEFARRSRMEQSLRTLHIGQLLENDATGEMRRTDATPETELRSPIIANEPTARFRVGVFASVLAAAVLIAGAAFAIYTLSGDATSEPTPRRAAPIATLTWADGPIESDQPLMTGETFGPQTLSTQTGATEFHLNSGATVELQGRSQITLHSSMASTLSRGTATFNCPPSAKGYTVHLPDGSRVVDLGTAFTLSVDESETTVLRVVEGEVNWTNGDDTDDAAEPTSVVAGHYAVIESGRLVSTGRAMSIASVDTIIDDANQEISRWRSPDFPKSFDTDGDHRYGSDGYALLGIKSVLPGYLEFVELGTDIRIPPANDRYAAVDRPAGGKRIKLRTLGRGDLNASPGDVVDVITYRITDASLAPRGFRIGIVTDGLNQADYASASIHVVDASGADHVHASIDVDRYRNEKLDMVFFDVTHVQTGDALTIRVAKSPLNTATIQAITWDPLPPHETDDTSSGENRPGALAPNPTSDPVQLQSTGPEKTLRKVRGERDEN